MNLEKAYIEFNENSFEFAEYDHINTLFIKTLLNDMTCLYDHGRKVFLNDILRAIGLDIIPEGWNYGLMKGKTISPNELNVDYSGKYVKIYLKGLIPAEQIFKGTEKTFIKED